MTTPTERQRRARRLSVEGLDLDTYRVIVCGSRDWPYIGPIREALDQLRAKWGERLVVVHGGCPSGADYMASRWAYAKPVQHEPRPAAWDELGKRAGPHRNQLMVDAGAREFLAFIKDDSRGSHDLVGRALAAGIPGRIWTCGGPHELTPETDLASGSGG